jgi:hypothetical protein
VDDHTGIPAEPAMRSAPAGPGGGRTMPGMAEMNGLDRQRLLTALVLLVMALFVGGGMARDPRWRGRLRRAAIIAFLFAAVAALAEIALWAAGFRQ